jgi:hypothetical protein
MHTRSLVKEISMSKCLLFHNMSRKFSTSTHQDYTSDRIVVLLIYRDLIHHSCIPYNKYNKIYNNMHKILVPNVMVEWLTLLLCIWEVPGSNLGPQQPAILFEGFHCFPQSLQANARILP